MSALDLRPWHVADGQPLTESDAEIARQLGLPGGKTATQQVRRAREAAGYPSRRGATAVGRTDWVTTIRPDQDASLGELDPGEGVARLRAWLAAPDDLEADRARAWTALLRQTAIELEAALQRLQGRPEQAPRTPRGLGRLTAQEHELLRGRAESLHVRPVDLAVEVALASRPAPLRRRVAQLLGEIRRAL